MRTSPPSGLVATLTLAGAAVLATPVAATADTPVSHSGTYGVHALIDTGEYPGARCRYEDGQLVRIRVRAPIVYRAEIFDGFFTHTHAWRAIVQRRSVGSMSWVGVARSPWQFTETRDDRPADFSPMAVAVEGRDGHVYRVLVRMLWGAGEKAFGELGRATHRVDRYRTPHGVRHNCPGAAGQ